MSRTQQTLSAFQTETAPEPEPEADGLHALGQRLLPGETTVEEQEQRASDRVVSDDTCPRCGAPYDGQGVCPEHEAEGEVVDDPLRTTGGGG